EVEVEVAAERGLPGKRPPHPLLLRRVAARPAISSRCNMSRPTRGDEFRRGGALYLQPVAIRAAVCGRLLCEMCPSTPAHREGPAPEYPEGESGALHGILMFTQFSPVSPPALFWSPSCTMYCKRYVWPACRIPAACSAPMSQIASAQ